MMRWPLLLAALSLALGQAGCGPSEPEPAPAQQPKPRPAPKVETRTLHELASTDDTDSLRHALQLDQPIDALDALGQTPLHIAAIKNKPANIGVLRIRKNRRVGLFSSGTKMLCDSLTGTAMVLSRCQSARLAETST